MIFFAAIAEIEKAQTVSLWPIDPAPNILPGTITTSLFLVTFVNLFTLTSLLFDLGPKSSSSSALQIGALFFLKALRRVQIVLSTRISVNILLIYPFNYLKSQINLPRHWSVFQAIE